MKHPCIRVSISALPILLTLTVIILLIPNFDEKTRFNRFSSSASELENKNLSVSCLVIIIGQTRSFELTYNSFEQHLLSPTKCDLALCVGTQSENKTFNPFYENAKYIWIWNETQFSDDLLINWEKSFDFMFNLTMKQYDGQYPNKSLKGNEWKRLYDFDASSPMSQNYWFGPLGNQQGYGALLIFFRQFLYFNIKKLNLIDKYEYFMYTRSDYKYLCDFPWNNLIRSKSNTDSKFITNKIWITSGEGYSGITDRNLLTSSKLFLDTLDIAMTIFVDYDKWYQSLMYYNKKHREMNIELTIKQHLLFKHLWKNVQVYDQVMYAVRSANTWSGSGKIGHWDAKQQLFIKYPPSYDLSVKTCLSARKT